MRPHLSALGQFWRHTLPASGLWSYLRRKQAGRPSRLERQLCRPTIELELVHAVSRTPGLEFEKRDAVSASRTTQSMVPRSTAPSDAPRTAPRPIARRARGISGDRQRNALRPSPPRRCHDRPPPATSRAAVRWIVSIRLPGCQPTLQAMHESPHQTINRFCSARTG
jgi:hypothetical protein